MSEQDSGLTPPRDKQLGKLELDKPDLTGIQRILQATLSKKAIEGNVSINELQSAFEHDQGMSLQRKDGYYRVTGLNNPSEGNLIRIKTTPNGKTLWYPTKVSDLAEAVAMSISEIKRIAFDKAAPTWDDLVALKAKGIDVNAYLTSKENEEISNYQVVDFGSGDGRLPMVSAAHGIPSIGIEIDDELLAMANTNITSAAKKGLLKAPAEVVEGSFFDDEVLKKILNRPGVPNSVCYLYITPYTWDLLLHLLPHLKAKDLLVTYKEKLSANPEEYEKIADRIGRKNEYFLMETPINTYRIK